MAGAEAAVQSFFLEKPEIPKKIREGTKFLKWPKADGEVRNNLVYFNVVINFMS